MSKASFQVICGDSLIELPRLVEQGIVFDACITDPPYGTTACAWDSVIPFEPMWANLKRLVKKNGAIVLFGSQPFTSALVMSNPKMFKYQWVWDKGKVTNFLHAKRQPMRATEDIAVFSSDVHTYNPQMTPTPLENKRPRDKVYRSGSAFPVASGITKHSPDRNEDERYPKNLLSIGADMGECNHSSRIHPTQKPVELMRYLVRTYTNEGETILDFAAGSFSTGVACMIENRNFIGIEQSAGCCVVGEARMKRAQGIACDLPRLNIPHRDYPLFTNDT